MSGQEKILEEVNIQAQRFLLSKRDLNFKKIDYNLTGLNSDIKLKMQTIFNALINITESDRENKEIEALYHNATITLKYWGK